MLSQPVQKVAQITIQAETARVALDATLIAILIKQPDTGVL
jgi:hypothetical protein